MEVCSGVWRWCSGVWRCVVRCGGGVEVCGGGVVVKTKNPQAEAERKRTAMKISVKRTEESQTALNAQSR